MISAKQFLPGLDVLRLLAALYIVMFHLSFSFSWPTLTRFFSRGPSATELFFLLSGFLLTHLYGTRTLTESERWQFLRKRWARIYPPYLLTGLLALGLGLWRGVPVGAQLDTLLLYVLMVQTWVVGESHALNGPGWSASCLMFFYLIFPVTVQWLRRMPARLLVLLAILLWLASSSGAFLLAQLPTVDLPSTWAMYLHNSPLLRSSGFVIGMIAALVLARRPVRCAPPGFSGINLLVLGALAFLPPDRLAVNNGVFEPLILLLIVAYIQAPEWVCTLAERRLFRRLVNASLCIYLLHMPLLRLSDLLFGPLTQGWQVVLYLLTVLWTSTLCNEVLCRYVTRPLSRPRPAAAGHPAAAQGAEVTAMPEPLNVRAGPV
ncbi:acyltransferase family protein [Deinococcus petrolearius]|uniref:Acyltransferase family protein n=1 Tax=Deinococcus petrolearius TaxID=1751295 RepID=A0ABW1DM90_9DEIO